MPSPAHEQGRRAAILDPLLKGAGTEGRSQLLSESRSSHQRNPVEIRGVFRGLSARRADLQADVRRQPSRRVFWGWLHKPGPAHVFAVKKLTSAGPGTINISFLFLQIIDSLLKTLTCCHSEAFVRNLESFFSSSIGVCWLRLKARFDNSQHRCFRRCKSSPVGRCR